MLHKYKLLVTLSFLSLFIISCSSTKLEVPTTEGEELKILYDQAISLVSKKTLLMQQLFLRILKDSIHIQNGLQNLN